MSFRLDRSGAVRLDRGPSVRVGATPVEVRPDGYKVYEGTATIGDVVLDYPEFGRSEFRPFSEVASDAALASMEGVPLSGGPRRPDDQLAADHAPDLITPETAGELTEGAVLKAWREDAVGAQRGRVRVRVIAYTKAIQDLIESGIVELSPGYRCREDPTPGVFDGRPYQVVQRGHQYNHLNVVVRARTRTPDGDVARLDADGETHEGASYPGTTSARDPEKPTMLEALFLKIMKARKDSAGAPIVLSEDDKVKIKELSPEAQEAIAALLQPAAPTPAAAPVAGAAAMDPAAIAAAVVAELAKQGMADAKPPAPGQAPAMGGPGQKKDGAPAPAANGSEGARADAARHAGINVDEVLARVKSEAAAAAIAAQDTGAKLVAAVRNDGHHDVYGPTDALARMLGTVKAELPGLYALAEADVKAGRFDSAQVYYRQAEELRRRRVADESIDGVLRTVQDSAPAPTGDEPGFALPAKAVG